MKNIIIEILLLASVFTSCAQSSSSIANESSSEIATISVDDFSSKLSTSKNALILDVRTAEEVAAGKIASALNIDFYNENFSAELDKLDKHKSIFLYCKSGGRSGQALSILEEKGFKNVYNLQGGMMAWNNAGKPVETSSTPEIKDEWTPEIYASTLAENETVLVDFYAQWCVPCKKMKPHLELLEKKYSGKAKILRIDVDKNPALTTKEGVTALPTIFLYKKGIKKSSITKELSLDELEKLLN